LIHMAASTPLVARTSVYYEGVKPLTSNLTQSPAGTEQSLWIAALLVPFTKPVGNPPQTFCEATPDGVRYTLRGAWGEDSITCHIASPTLRLGDPVHNSFEVVRQLRDTGSVSFTIETG
jgi:hypothetical protein